MERFQKDLEENEELKNNWNEALKKEPETGTISKREAMVETAKKMGYDLTVADFEKALAEKQTLSEESLEQISGGVLFLDDDAPDGHEKTCGKFYYRNYDLYGEEMPPSSQS